MDNIPNDPSFEQELEEAVLHSLEEDATIPKKNNENPPNKLYVFPLLRRPFFPGMAAPLVIEPGPFYEVLKQIAQTEHKSVGLLLTKKEDANLYKLKFKDLYDIGVMARILRIIPMEKGGAQVVLNMEKRIKILKPIHEGKLLKTTVHYHEDNPLLSKELKAYAISIISTIKDLLKLNPLFKEELQIFLGHSDFTEPGKLADFAVALTTASREELQEVLEAFDIQLRIDKALFSLKKN